MAAVVGAAWKASIIVEDGELHTSTVKLNFDGAATPDQISGFMELFVPILQVISSADVRSVSISKLTNLFPTGAGEGDVEEGAAFYFEAEDTQKLMKVRVPAIEDALIPDDTNKVNDANADVADFVDAFVTGLNSVLPRDSETRVITGLRVGIEDYTKARR